MSSLLKIKVMEEAPTRPPQVHLLYMDIPHKRNVFSLQVVNINKWAELQSTNSLPILHNLPYPRHVLYQIKITLITTYATVWRLNVNQFCMCMVNTDYDSKQHIHNQLFEARPSFISGLTNEIQANNKSSYYYYVQDQIKFMLYYSYLLFSCVVPLKQRQHFPENPQQLRLQAPESSELVSPNGIECIVEPSLPSITDLINESAAIKLEIDAEIESGFAKSLGKARKIADGSSQLQVTAPLLGHYGQAWAVPTSNRQKYLL